MNFFLQANLDTSMLICTAESSVSDQQPGTCTFAVLLCLQKQSVLPCGR